MSCRAQQKWAINSTPSPAVDWRAVAEMAAERPTAHAGYAGNGEAVSDADILSAARKIGLRQMMHGISATAAVVVLREFLSSANPPAQPKVRFVAACSGLQYENPMACGEVSAVIVGDKFFALPAQPKVPDESILREKPIDWDYGYTSGWNSCRQAMLSAQENNK